MRLAIASLLLLTLAFTASTVTFGEAADEKTPMPDGACCALPAHPLAAAAPKSACEDGTCETEDCAACEADEEEADVPPALNHVMKDINGEDVNLAKYQGKVVLMVNVASKCGYTPQYAGLQKLHETYAKQGLQVLGFPCNQFGGQEPGTNEDIAAFCEENFGVTFPLLDKINVNGDNAAPLYSYLTSKKVEIEDQGEVKWNFEKFLLDREGNVIARFRSADEPDGEKMLNAIKQALEG